MLYTSRFSNPELKSGKYTAVRISLGAPKWPLGYEIAGTINDLMPYGLLNIQDKELYERKYRERLDRVGVDRIYRQIQAFDSGKPVVLLCYEDVRDPLQWCHRTMFAKWLLEKTGEIADELPDPTTVKVKGSTGVQKAKETRASAAVPAVPNKAEQRIKDREAEQMQLSMFGNGRW